MTFNILFKITSMRQKLIFPLAITILLICFSCEKNSDNPSVDLSVNATGMYSGTWVVVGTGQAAGTCSVNKVSTTSVNLIVKIGGIVSPISPEINLSDGGSGKIILSYTDSEGTINGTIVNKVLALTLKSGSITETFTGTKP
jgi:hypothetical protein